MLFHLDLLTPFLGHHFSFFHFQNRKCKKYNSALYNEGNMNLLLKTFFVHHKLNPGKNATIVFEYTTPVQDVNQSFTFTWLRFHTTRMGEFYKEVGEGTKGS